jgi:propionyl-CoA synthetase
MPSTYHEVYARWRAAPEAFWAEAAELVHWYRRWDAVLDASRSPVYRWFTGGQVNSCYNALDRHVENGRADQAALIYDSPVTSTVRAFSYRELRDEVARFAGALVERGVTRGDRVVLYMPMVPETVIAMLACARIGAIHSVVFGGFAAPELASRITDARPKAILSASCGIEVDRVVPYKPLLDRAIELASFKPECCIVLQRPQAHATLMPGRDHEWAEVHARATPVDCVPLEATDPLYIIYTSGTTGNPKGIVRDNGGHLVALTWSMRHVYGVEPGEVYWAASDLGWTVGHSYIVYGPLFHREHHGALRGEAGGHARRGRVLAGHRAARRARVLHRADGVSRHQAGRSRRRAHPALRPRLPPHALPGRRALRPRDARLGPGAARDPRDRSLVADRDRLAGRLQLRRPRAAPGEARIVRGAGAGLRRAGAHR